MTIAKLHSLRLFAVALVLGGLAAPAFAEQSVAARIRDLTGARTKIAWIRASGGQGHPFGPGMGGNQDIWRIVTIDTDLDGGRERYLTEKPGDYNHVEITPNGKRVLWCCSTGVWVGDWEGGNQKKLLDQGRTVGTAEDPVGTDWVYVAEGKNAKGVDAVYRYQIDDLAKKEVVWDKNNTNDKWELSRDGKFAVSRWNLGPVGIVAMPNGELTQPVSDGGCTPGMAADLSLVTHMKAMGHAGIYVFNRDGSNERYIDFTKQAPGAKEVPLPQFWWCNFARYDKRFYSFSGPHSNMEYNPAGSNIYFCRFNEKFDNFDRWIIVTDNPEMDTQSYVWIDPTPAPGPAAGLRIDAVIDSRMGASLKEPAVVTVTNTSGKDWRGVVKLTLEAGLKAAQPDGLPIAVAQGATATVSLDILKDPALNAGRFRKLAADIAVADAQGRVLDWSRQWFKVGCPVELVQTEITAFDQAAQPMPVIVRNLANQPVSGKLRLELVGPNRIGPVERDFGPIPGGKEATVAVVVPNLDIRGYNWQATFTAQANGLEQTLGVALVTDRRWLLLGPYPNSVPNPWDQDFGPEKDLAGGLDPAKTYEQTVAPTRGYGGWDGLKQQWDDYFKSRPAMKWMPSPPVRAVAGGPHVESIGYLNLYDYYQDVAKLPNQMAVAYCLQFVKSPDARKVVMATGEAGWMKVWINGKEVLSDKKQEGAHPGKIKTEVELKAGWNEVVLKQGAEFFGYGFYFDFIAPDGKTVGDLCWALAKTP
jgi:hypothetical protein